tara:strand:- start:13407 stop:13880 length:474 start_codon:yes stop_codon:yes gene_type:complete
MYVPFDKIDENAKCWIYILEKNINFKSDEINLILKSLCEKWKSHNNEVVSSFQIYRDRYIILFAEEGISGCSIDSSNRLLRYELDRLNISVMPNSKIGIFIENKIKLEDRSSIINLIKANKLQPNDKMINTTVTNKKEYNKNWILEINKSWLTNFIK